MRRPADGEGIMRAVPASVLVTAAREPEGTASPDSEPPARWFAPVAGAAGKVEGRPALSRRALQDVPGPENRLLLLRSLLLRGLLLRSLLLGSHSGITSSILFLGLCSPNHRDIGAHGLSPGAPHANPPRARCVPSARRQPALSRHRHAVSRLKNCGWASTRGELSRIGLWRNPLSVN